MEGFRLPVDSIRLVAICYRQEFSRLSHVALLDKTSYQASHGRLPLPPGGPADEGSSPYSDLAGKTGCWPGEPIRCSKPAEANTGNA